MRFILKLMMTFCCGLVIATMSVTQVRAAENRTFKLVFAPFDDGSAGGFKYLRNSIQTMLATRLAAVDNVVIVDQNLSAGELLALRKGAEQQFGNKGVRPDYLVDGALFGLKGGLNTQVVLYPFEKEGKVYRFSITSQDTSTLISDVDKLSSEIASEVFGVKPVVAAPIGSGSDGEGTSAFVTAHPEAAFKRKMYGGAILAADDFGMEVKTIGGKKTKDIDGEMITMTAADLDGDGSEELLVLFPDKIAVYSISEEAITALAEITLPKGLKCHGLNVADVDGDDVSEIYVSATRNLNVSSLVYEWSNQSPILVAKGIPYYVRPVTVPGLGLILAGQKRGLERTQFQQPGLFVLHRTADNSFELGKPLSLPESVNLFDFVYADLDGDNTSELVVVDRKERLKVFSSTNELLWVSKKSFGGSKIYIGPSMGEAKDDKQTPTGFSADEEDKRELDFVPGNLWVVDINDDHKAEIVISQQDGLSIPFFHRLRLYSSGSVAGLSWQNEELRETWKTSDFSGYIAGYGVSDVVTNGEGDAAKARMKLYVGHVADSGSLMSLLPGTSNSTLTTYEMEFVERKAE